METKKNAKGPYRDGRFEASSLAHDFPRNWEQKRDSALKGTSALLQLYHSSSSVFFCFFVFIL